jgi:hypothetical protein
MFGSAGYLDLRIMYRVENRSFARKYRMRMSGLICRILGVVVFAATLFLSGCNFGADNVGDIYSSGQTGQNSLDHTVPESKKSGTVTGEPAPETAR